MKLPGLLALLLVGIALQPARAQLKDENLLAPLPAGFKVGYQASNNGLVMQEFIPAGETVEDWSEMVTAQIFLGRRDLDGVRALGLISQGWINACPASKPNRIGNASVNGYAAWNLFLQCPLLASTGKPETTFFRAVKGNDSFYIVQRAARAMPGQAQLVKMTQYLDTTTVCDTRTSDHPCPDLKGQGFRPQ
jgi:hypothetical protein